MLFCFWPAADAAQQHLYAHVFADFGAAGTPGTWKLLFADAVCGMARAAGKSLLPKAIHVDDVAVVGPTAQATNADMASFQEYCSAVCGVHFKVAKDRAAATNQYVIGFWWDSLSLTLTLHEQHLWNYAEYIADLAGRRSLSLREMQSAAGKMQRAIVTFPPGARCLLTSLFRLTVGLRLPWQRRRLTQGARMDMNEVLTLLGLNLGRGHYSYAHFMELSLIHI